MRGALRVILLVASIAVVIASFVNVFGEDGPERAIADQIACGPKACPGGTEIAIQKSPIGKSFEYRFASRSITVRCMRAAILAGAWSCAAE